ncbi:DNA-binding GntR family transcriptional regulator [Paenarthrobacter nitroguajacolicus]|uniref:GntR family transcriptional regulator n=1 Tax=Paenarthrobacter TaxID=1742992 RepID=UPI00285ACCFE|nr:GntR family transcriptional regulator [Paenarthrobacter nitroguajacolicus]MDR6988206.1 DNA-binding GntR family transcriptional regulator [Paenarthrobacter nitroguajacolicus]
MNAALEALESPPQGTSLAENAYLLLRDRLIMLDIKPGDPINDGQIAAELGIGRTPVREAIKRLESDHLVVSYPRRGTFATGVDITQLAEVSEIRELLEPLASRKAARMASPAMRSELRAVAAAIRDLEGQDASSQELMRYDIQVHRLIYKASSNAHLEDVLIRYDNLATRIWCHMLEKMPSVSGHISEHTDLLTAIADGDEDRAAELALHHVVSFEETIRKVL